MPQKFEVFKDWCHKNNMKFPDQELCQFEGGLIGIKALKDIEHRQAFCTVPFNCLLSVYGAKQNPDLRVIIQENPELFSEDEEDDAECLILVLLMLYEMQKGDNSFWKPYFDVLPEVVMFCNWSNHEMAET